MSRVGKKLIPIPAGVNVGVQGNIVTVKGAKATLTQDVQPSIVVKVEDAQVAVTRTTDLRRDRAFHGLYRQLIANMITGVTDGFTKELEIVGVGYRAQIQGSKLVLQIGFCHSVEMLVPTGLELQVPAPTQIVIQGADKQMVGEFAAQIRKIRPPEPYKGKGIRYAGEEVIRKAGKAFGSGD